MRVGRSSCGSDSTTPKLKGKFGSPATSRAASGRGRRHRPQETDASARELGQGGNVLFGVLRERRVLLTGDVDDSYRAAHDRNRHAHRRQGPFGPAPELGAGVQLVAVGEPLHLGPT